MSWPGSRFAISVSGGLSHTWGFLGGRFGAADFLVPNQAADNAGDQGEGQRHGAGKDNAVKAEQAAQYEEKRQEKQPLIQQRDEGGVGRLSGGLQKGLAELIQAVEGPDDYGGKYKNLTICNHFRVIDKGGDDGVSGKKADDGEKAAESCREEGCIADDFPHALEIARTVIIGDGGLQSHADAHGKHGDEHADFAGNALGRQRNSAVADDHAVGDDMGHAVQKSAEGHGKPQGHDAERHLRAEGKLFRGQRKRRLPAADIVQQIGAADTVAQYGGEGGSCHIPGKYQDEQGVQPNVGQGAQTVGNHGLPSCAVRADHVGEHVVEHDEGRAEGNDPQVGDGVGQGVCVCAQSLADGGDGQVDHSQKEQSKDKRGIAAEGRVLFYLIRIFLPQSQGDGRTAAAAKQGAQPGQDGKHRTAERDGGNFSRVAGLADEEGVSHIVNDHHQHDDYGRQA